ncbi:MAG: methyltransferase domain-containing protein [Bradymonadales bacterium]
MDRAQQTHERLQRQKRIDETYVESSWMRLVDALLVEISLGRALPYNSMILLPELRMTTLLRTLVESFPKQIKLMIVDQSNTRFDMLRAIVPAHMANAYFSTQMLSALNYSDNVFDLVLTQLSLTSLSQHMRIFPEYHRVLKPNASFVFATPIEGTLSPFFDFLSESLLKLAVVNRDSIIGELRQAMQPQFIRQMLAGYGFRVISEDVVSFSMQFPSTEDFLFSTLIESFYLAACLNILPRQEGKTLLTQVVKSFHHYYQGLGIDADMHMLCVLCEKT